MYVRPDVCQNEYCRFVFAERQGGWRNRIQCRPRVPRVGWVSRRGVYQGAVRDLANTRNHNTLEHGYGRVQRQANTASNGR